MTVTKARVIVEKFSDGKLLESKIGKKQTDFTAKDLELLSLDNLSTVDTLAFRQRKKKSCTSA